jgi:hypothetical protein
LYGNDLELAVEFVCDVLVAEGDNDAEPETESEVDDEPSLRGVRAR